MILVPISAADYGVDIRLAYATAENFTQRPIYRHARCYLHADAAAALRRAVDLAGALGYHLRIFDAFRPSEAQWAMWTHTPGATSWAPHVLLGLARSFARIAGGGSGGAGETGVVDGA